MFGLLDNLINHNKIVIINRGGVDTPNWHQFSSVVQSCLTLSDPMECSTPGLPVHYQLPEFTHTHVHQVGDAIQPSHPLLSPSPPAFNLSQHHGLFKWVIPKLALKYMDICRDKVKVLKKMDQRRRGRQSLSSRFRITLLLFVSFLTH